MDLLQTVRKEGARGGRANFSWDDVKADQHRENYLGHSLMAPVGRWQKNKDLSWYARSDGANQTEEERKQAEIAARKEEIRLIKEAESDALARALGYEVPDRTNPNLTQLGPKGSGEEAQRKIKETVDEEEADMDAEGGKGLGFGAYGGSLTLHKDGDEDVLEGTRGPERDGMNGRGSLRARPKETARRADDRKSKVEGHRDRKHRRRSRSRERSRERRGKVYRDIERPRDHARDERRRRVNSHAKSRSPLRSRQQRRSRSPDSSGRKDRDKHKQRERYDDCDKSRHDESRRQRRRSKSPSNRRRE